MAVFVDAQAERDRLMQSYVGVTARIEDQGGGDFLISVHDVRASERKTVSQVGLGAGRAWSLPWDTTFWQIEYV